MFGFGKKKTVADDNKLYTPVTGEVIQLENVSDPVFAGKMMGGWFCCGAYGWHNCFSSCW